MPGAITSTASDRLPKSAERIEGATRISGGRRAVSIAGEPTGGRRRSPSTRAAPGRPGAARRISRRAARPVGAHARAASPGIHRSPPLGLHGDQADPVPVAGHHLGAVERPG